MFNSSSRGRKSNNNHSHSNRKILKNLLPPGGRGEVKLAFLYAQNNRVFVTVLIFLFHILSSHFVIKINFKAICTYK